MIERPGDLAAILTNLERGDVLFIDEIHRLSHVVEEILYPAMEDFQLDIMIGQGPSARSIKLDAQAVHAGRRDDARRAAHVAAARPLRRAASASTSTTAADLEPDPAPLGARSWTCRSTPTGAAEIARRSRGTPRIANRLLRRVRDFAQVRAEGAITRDRRAPTRSRCSRSTTRGFDQMDRALLLAIIDKFDGGPVGLDTLAAAIGEERDTIEDVYEPFLIQEGFLARTPKGRVATARAYGALRAARRSRVAATGQR